MNIHNFFDNPDDALIDRITEEYPILDTDEKERLYAMSKNKYNSDIKNEKNNGTEVSGVERYHKPLWHKVLSAVAAAVVVVGGVGGGVLLLGKGGGVDPMTDIEATEPAEEEVTEAAEVEETEPEIEQADYDYTAIAQQLFDDYLEVERIICWGDVSYDENDSITFYTYASGDAEWSEKYGGERTFYKVTDERFSSCQEIYEMMKTISSSECMPEENYQDTHWIDNEATLLSWLGGDVSMFEVGGDVDLDDADAERMNAAYDVNNGVFVEYNGELYVKPRYFEALEFTSDAVVKEIGENSFTASRYVREPYIPNAKYGSEKILQIILENDEWKIDSIETGTQVEYFTAIGIQCYLEDKPEYYDIDIDCGDITAYLEVTEYDEEKQTCSAHAVLRDVNGEEAIEMTAEVIVNASNSNVAVKSAEITRLNEYDGTLKRPSVLWAEQQGTLEN